MIRLGLIGFLLLTSCNEDQQTAQLANFTAKKASIMVATGQVSKALQLLKIEGMIANARKENEDVVTLADAIMEDGELMDLLLHNGSVDRGKKPSRPPVSQPDHPSVPQPDFLINLNHQAERGMLMPVIGRDDEISEVLEVLGQHLKSNPILIGDAGVGKTAIVEGLAQRIVSGNVPETFRHKIVYAVDVGALMAGNVLVGMIEHKVMQLLDFIKNSDDNILFIDEFHRLMTGHGQGVAELLKPSLSRDRVCCIAATTTDEYQKHLLADPAMTRRFQAITIGEPSIETSLEIVNGLRDTLSGHHKIKISNEALEASVSLTQQFLPDKKLPDKAIEVIDRASSALKTVGDNRELERRHIASVIAKQTGIPVEQILQDPNEKIANLLPQLKNEIVGQDQALTTISQMLTSAYMGLTDKNRPLSTFMLSGPTGVGKTETAKVLAMALDLELFRLDMSEYHDRHTVNKLIGSPSGYIGSQDGGILTNKVQRTKHLLILFDEIEKAHSGIYPLFLQVLEEGQLTDGRGNVVDFSNTIVIFTTNADDLNRVFPREFLGRIDRVIDYQPLTTEVMYLIVKKQIEMLNDNLRATKDIQLTISDSASEALVNYGFDREFGARSLRSSFVQLISFPLAEKLNAGQLSSGDYLLDFVPATGWQLQGGDGSIVIIGYPPKSSGGDKQRSSGFF